jgi:membrane protein involved in colicin uptake
MFLLSITFGQEMKNPMLIWSVVVIALIVNISLWFGTFQNIEAKTTGGGGGVEMQNMSKGGGKKQISNMFEDYNFNIAKELKKLHKTI